VRSGATISLYIDGYLFFKTNYAVDHTGNWFGVGHVTANDATKPAMSDTKFIVGKEKVEAYLTVLGAVGCGAAEPGANQQPERRGAERQFRCRLHCFGHSGRSCLRVPLQEND